MDTRQIKLIELEAKEWFDKINGNSYFSCNIIVNGKLVHTLPFQYGYGSHYEELALQWLKDNLFSKQVNKKILLGGWGNSLSYICREYIKCYLVSNKCKALKRDLVG